MIAHKITRIHENMKNFQVCDVVVGSFSRGSKLSTLNVKLGVAVISIDTLKNHLYEGNKNESELIGVSCHGHTSTHAVWNVFSNHSALYMFHCICTFWDMLPWFLTKKLSVALPSSQMLSQILLLDDSLSHLDFMRSMDLEMSASHHTNILICLLTIATIVNIPSDSGVAILCIIHQYIIPLIHIGILIFSLTILLSHGLRGNVLIFQLSLENNCMNVLSSIFALHSCVHLLLRNHSANQYVTTAS